MGKRLIIKDADFSANGIPLNLTDYLKPLVIGAAWLSGIGNKNPPTRTTNNNARASTEDFVDISAVANLLGEVRLTPKTGYKIAAYFGNKGNQDSAVPTGWGYTNSGDTLVVDITNCTYGLIMVASNDNSALTSTDWSTYLTES